MTRSVLCWLTLAALAAGTASARTVARSRPTRQMLPAGLSVSGTLSFQDAHGIRHLLRGRTDTAVPTAAPIWESEISPRHRRVAYGLGMGSDWPNRLSLWKCRLDGSARVNLTAVTGLGGTNCWPHWSPNGKKIAFQHSDPVKGKRPCEAGFRPWVMTSDGRYAHPLSAKTGRLKDSATWLPDGRHLFAYQTDGTTCIVSVDGQVLKPLPNVGTGAIMSPDGAAIASCRVRHDEVDGKPGHWFELIITDAEGGHPRAIVRQFLSREDMQLGHPGDAEWADGVEATLGALQPAWSPRGERLAFVAALPYDPHGAGPRDQQEVWIYDFRTDQLTRVTSDHMRQWSLSWRK